MQFPWKTRSHTISLPSASWKTRGIIQSKSKSLRTTDTNGEFPGLSPKAENQEHWRPRSEGRRRRQRGQKIHPSSDFLFCSGPQQIAWCPPTLMRVIFAHTTDPNANRHPHRTHPEIMVDSYFRPLFYQADDKNITTRCYGGNVELLLNFPGGASDKELACQCRRCKRRGLDPWTRRSWEKWQLTPVLLFQRIPCARSLAGYGPGHKRVGPDWSNLAHCQTKDIATWDVGMSLHSNKKISAHFLSLCWVKVKYRGFSWGISCPQNSFCFLKFLLCRQA